MRSRLFVFALLVLLLDAAPAGAHDGPADARDRAPGHARRDLRQLATHVVGGASLLVDVSSAPSVVEFHKQAHHFEESLGRNRDHVGDDWRTLRRAFTPARKTASRGRDPRIEFLLSHLEEDLVAGDRLVASHATAAPPPGGSVSGPGRVSFIDQQTCVGINRIANSCGGSRDTLTFPIPRHVAVITRLDAEWRDFGRATNGEIYVNDHLVWQSDVARDWDTDAKTLDIHVPPGSTLSVRSSNGDPIWIRRLGADTQREATSAQASRGIWEFLWPEGR